MSKDNIELKKYFILPWGFLTSIAAIMVVLIPVLAFLINIEWLKWVLVSISIIVSIGVLLGVNFLVPKGIEGKYNIYVMVAPIEEIEIDKLIKSDVQDCLSEYDENDINFIVPNYFQRYTFNQIIKRKKREKKNFIESNFFSYFIGRTHATAILFGTIKKRKETEDKYIFDLGSIYYCDIKNKKVNDFANKSVNNAFTNKLEFNQQNEVTGMQGVTLYIEDIMTYIIGLSEFSALHFQVAFDIHYNLYKKKRSPIFSQKANFRAVLTSELSILYSLAIQKADLINARKIAEINLTIDKSSGSFLMAQLVMLEAKDEKEFRKNTWKALKLISGQSNTLTYIADKAYLSLVLGQYNEAEKWYKDFFSKVAKQEDKNNALNGIIQYCEIAQTRDFEKPFVFYLIGKIAHFMGKMEEAINYYTLARNIVDKNHYIYKDAEKYIQENSQT